MSSAAFYSQTENTTPRCQYRSGFDQPPLRLIFTSPESLFTSPESVFTSVRNLYSHRCGISIHIVRNTQQERVLRDFFEDKATADELARDVAGSLSQKSQTTSVVSIADMDEEFAVTAAMLVRLCDVVLQGKLDPDALHAIGFALMASDGFFWDADDDDVLAKIIADSAVIMAEWESAPSSTAPKN